MDFVFSLPGLCGLGLTFRLDGFRVIFTCLTTYMWVMTSLFTLEYLAHSGHKKRYWLFLWLTYAATMGVFLSDDLYTAFVFFEIMSLCSYVCVIHDEKPATIRAGGVYLAVAVIGGLAALMGIFILYRLAGTLALDALWDKCGPILRGEDPAARRWLYIAGGCVLFGFGAKAGMFPVHIWLPMAHPVAPAPASALLSGIITKSGIFGLLVLAADVFRYDSAWGFAVCLLGTVTMLLGGVLAVFSVDIKRTLACSSMSQLGMIITGIGMQDLLGHHNALAVRGTLLHMVNHANLKLVLFMAAGVIVMNLHRLDLNEIRGYGRKKPLLKAVFLAGALGIGGIPLFNGYISKTLLHESIVEYVEFLREGEAALTFLTAGQAAALFRCIEWLFLLTGGMTVAYMTKLFVCVFVEKNADPARQAEFDADRHYCTPLTGAVLGIAAAVLPLLGILPGQTQDMLADWGQGFLHGTAPAEPVAYFSPANLKGGLISVAMGAVIYLGIVRRSLTVRREDGTTAYVDRWPPALNLLTGVYEPLLRGLAAVLGTLCRWLNILSDGLVTFLAAKLVPEVLGLLCRWLNSLSDGLLTFLAAKFVPGAVGLLCRMLDFLTDGLILLLRKTTHRQLPDREDVPGGYVFSYYAGGALNTLNRLLRRTVLARWLPEKDYVPALAERQAVFREAHRMIGASAAFSLLMLGLGLAAIIVYILAV